MPDKKVVYTAFARYTRTLAWESVVEQRIMQLPRAREEGIVLIHFFSQAVESAVPAIPL
ncbi:hypothetical protein [Thiogranum longum]